MMQQRIKRLAFVFLALHALVDLTLAPIIYHQLGILAPAIFIIAICCIFTFKLFFSLRNEEFYSRRFPGRWGRGRIDMWGNPIAFWVTFAVLVVLHLFITVQMAVLIL